MLLISSLPILYHSKAYIEIENPFAQDSNDLPLVEICSTLLQNIEDLISFNLSDRIILDASESPELEHLCVCLTL
jgi:predicted membrane chloride channel (bestrophin family)